MIVVGPPSSSSAPDAEPRTASVTASLTESEKSRLRAAAAASGVSMSALVRAALLAYLKEP